jgi:DNA-binding PadR family transcriptional regulator
MEKKLLILGLLQTHGMHGYQLNEILKQNPGIPISLKKSNAYKLLTDMEKDGWVTHIQEQEGNRPQRRVYSVTDEGEKAFYLLLRENLSTHSSSEFPSVVGLDFIHMLPIEESVSLLEQRLSAVDKKFQQLDDISTEIRQYHLATDYLHQHYAKEIEWLNKVISHLQSKKNTPTGS